MISKELSWGKLVQNNKLHGGKIGAILPCHFVDRIWNEILEKKTTNKQCNSTALVETLRRCWFLGLARPCRSLGCDVFSYLQPSSQTCPDDTDQAGHNSQEHHSVADFHAVGPAEIAQGGTAAFGGNGRHAKVHVSLRTVCRTLLGDAVSRVLAWMGSRRERTAVI